MQGGGASALSNDGGGSWTSYRDITISNPGSALSDYQVLVDLTGAAFPAGASTSGADIRFTDAGGTELNYWIESWGVGSAKVWVNVTSVPAGTTTIRMYYGNPSATSFSNGDAAFDFFDDFNGNSLELSKWDVTSEADYILSDGIIKIKGNYLCGYGKPAIYSKKSFNDYVMQVRVSEETDNSLGDINYWLLDKNHYYAIQHQTRTHDWDFVVVNGGYQYLFKNYEYRWNVNEWVYYTFKVHSSVKSIM